MNARDRKQLGSLGVNASDHKQLLRDIGAALTGTSERSNVVRHTTFPTSEMPAYRKVKHGEAATDLWFITCDEGWRQSIVCERMYEPTADWLLHVLVNRPFLAWVKP